MKSMGMFLLMVLWSGFSWAATNGAISTATAGTGRASVEATDSPFLNPATIPFLGGYFFTSSYSSASDSASTSNSDFTLSITDNLKETVVPTSIGYSQVSTKMSDNSKIYSRDFRLAFGEKVSDRFAVGLSGHYKNDQSDFDSYGQNNLTLASVVSITPKLSFGLVFDDFLNPPGSVPEELRLKSTIGMGISYNYKKVIRTRVDLISGSNNNMGKPTLACGLESYMNKWLILRMGLGRNQEKSSNIYSAGIGFQGPKFGLHYAYMNSHEDENLVRHSIDLALPIW